MRKEMNFFFASRRRHTRLQGDWSSDVCSSDLERHRACGPGRRTPTARRLPPLGQAPESGAIIREPGRERAAQIGRASCRERVWMAEDDGAEERKRGEKAGGEI